VRILDGCCGAGGAARGYVDAGHEVSGIDIRRALEGDYLRSGAVGFRVQDILEALASPWIVRNVEFVHVSPPCQHYSQMSRCRPGIAQAYPDLIGPVRELLNACGKPWVIENVSAARPWMKDPVVLCGTMFGRPMYRHRLFEAGGGFSLSSPQPAEGMPGRRNRECGWPHLVPTARAGHWEPGKYVSVAGHERRGPVNQAMGIDWMSDREDVAESVPPCFTNWIGQQLGSHR
jgi:DNA (cytosine-5)-methyltransferase 1